MHIVQTIYSTFNRFFCIATIAICFTGRVIAQPVYEKGQLPIVNFSSKEYNTAPQNWKIVSDNQSLIYVANNNGILIYDGEKWQEIKNEAETPVYSIDINQHQQLFYGGIDEIGVVLYDSLGKPYCHNLTNHVSEKRKEFGRINNVICLTKGTYFQSENYLFLWDGNSMREWEFESSVLSSYLVNSTIFFEIDTKKNITHNNVLYIKEDSLVTLQFKTNSTDGRIISITKRESNELLIATETNGITKIHIDSNHLEEKLKTEINELNFYKKSVKSLKNKNLSIGYWGQGLVVLDQKGKINNIINRYTGLQDNIVENQFEDSQQNLWLALSNGVSVIKQRSPLSFFAQEIGLEGTVENIDRSFGNITIATHNGIYTLNSKHPSGKNNKLLDFSLPKFNFITFGESAWYLEPFICKNDTLLIASLNDGVYEFDKKEKKQLIHSCLPYDIYQSKLDKNRLYVGLEDGFISLYRKKGKWIKEHDFQGISGTIYKIQEDEEGNLWLGTLSSGLYYILNPLYKENKPTRIDFQLFDQNQELPSNGPVHVDFFNNKTIVATDNGLYTFNDSLKQFIPYQELNSLFPENTAFHRISSDYRGNLWYVAYDSEQISKKFIGYIVKGKQGNFLLKNKFFAPLTNNVIHAIYHEPDGITWLGGPEGLFRYDINLEPDSYSSFSCQVRKVILGEDSTIFFGNYVDDVNYLTTIQPESFKPTLPFEFNSISFEFAGQSYEGKNTKVYSYYLEGYDKTWTNWKSETKAVYTNLHEGTYTFKVKCKNLYDVESSIAAYEFTILPPFYRTLWAYFLYAIGLVIFIYIIIRLNSRRLVKEKIALEKVVKERTAEIVTQKEQIEEKTKEIVDSINYAQKIQKAILPQKEISEKLLPEHFVLFKPKDIVSGDFYWITEKNNKVFFSAADCTGHGVPGAFMSMIGTSLLNEVVNEKNVLSPAEILNHVRDGIIKSLKQGEWMLHYVL